MPLLLMPRPLPPPPPLAPGVVLPVLGVVADERAEAIVSVGAELAPARAANGSLPLRADAIGC